METQKQNPQADALEQALVQYEQEQNEFENHWVWKKLGCKPKQFFQAVQKHVDSMNVSKEQWEGALTRAKQAPRVQTAEKRASFDHSRLQMMSHLQV